MLNSIKTLQIYCKVTLNAYFNKKKLLMMTKNYLYDRYFVSNLNFISRHKKKVFNSRIFTGFQVILNKILGFLLIFKFQDALGFQALWQLCTFKIYKNIVYQQTGYKTTKY